MALTNYAETALLAALLGEQAFTSPPTVYLGLFTTVTSDAGGGTEVVGGSYVRQPVTFNTVTSGATTNDADVVFTDMPDVTVTHGALFDAESGGNMLSHGALSPQQDVVAGSTLTLSAGSISATMD